MESPESVPALNLERIASDRQISMEARNELQMETKIPSEAASTSSESSERIHRRKSYLSLATDESTLLGDSFRSPAREIIAPTDSDKHLRKVPGPEDRKNELALECSRESSAQETIVAENRMLREVLCRERRYHTKEKNRIRQVLLAIDEALSGLPSRLGRIRLQNQKNLMKMNAPPVQFRDRGDCQTIVEVLPPKRLPVAGGSAQFSDFSDASSPLFKKMDSLDNLIEQMKKGGQPATIEALLNNELCAISRLKNAVRYTKHKIDRKKSDSETVSAHWRSENEVPNQSGWVPERSVNSEDLRKLEQYICLQKEAIRVLSLENRKAMELISKEAKEKQQIQSEKKGALFETMKLKYPKEDTQKSKTGSTDQTRPFRMIKDLKNQLEEKDKMLATMRSKISRLEAAAANKGTLLEIERKKTEELEAKLKILSSENASFSMQMTSLRYINKELKEQMEVLKSQIDILIKENAGFSSNPFDLRKYFEELSEQLQKDDSRVKAVLEDADKRLKEMEDQCSREVDLIRVSFEKSEKSNYEHMRTLKSLILYMHNYQIERSLIGKMKSSYAKVKEILGISELELGTLLSGNLRETGYRELEDLYKQCYAYVHDEKDCEFSVKLSAWLFDLIKETMTNPNSNDMSE